MSAIVTCLRCEKEPPRLGSMFCEACDVALKTPEPPRPENGKPAKRRLKPNPPAAWKAPYGSGGGKA